MLNQYQFRFYHPLFLLLIPFIGNVVSAEVNWSWFDFMVMSVLLLSLGLGIGFVLKKFAQSKNRKAYLAAIILVFLLIWAELAVGIFGSPLAGQ